jgi:predicted thioesterase
MSLRHVAITPGPRGSVRVAARQHFIAGRMHHFIVDAFDERGLIAVSEHTRAVVNDRRFRAATRRRAGRISMLLRP